MQSIDYAVSTAAVARAARMSVPLLEKWVRTGIVSPSHRVGRTLCWGACDAVGITFANKLRQAGGTKDRIRRVIGYFESLTWDEFRITIAPGPRQRRWLVANDERAVLIGRSRLVELLEADAVSVSHVIDAVEVFGEFVRQFNAATTKPQEAVN